MHQAGLRLHALKTQLFIHGSTTADVECSFVCLDFSNKCLENRIILQGFVYLFKIGLTLSIDLSFSFLLAKFYLGKRGK